MMVVGEGIKLMLFYEKIVTNTTIPNKVYRQVGNEVDTSSFG